MRHLILVILIIITMFNELKKSIVLKSTYRLQFFPIHATERKFLLTDKIVSLRTK